MSIWECGCEVISKTPGIQASQVYAHLNSCEFKYTKQNSTIKEHFEFVYEDELYILEALADMTSNCGEAPCLSISLRFAICNPESAVAVLVDKAIRLAQLLNGYVLDDYRNQYKAQNGAEKDLLIRSLSSDYDNRTHSLKEKLGLQYPVAKRSVFDFSRDLTLIRKRRSMPPDGEKTFKDYG